MPTKPKDESAPERARRSWRKTREILNDDEPNVTAADAAIDAMVRRSIKDHGA